MYKNAPRGQWFLSVLGRSSRGLNYPLIALVNVTAPDCGWLRRVAYPRLAARVGQWGESPTQLRQWFQSLMQPDNPYLSCCGEADAFEADTFEIDGDHYVAVITDGKGGNPAPGSPFRIKR